MFANSSHHLGITLRTQISHYGFRSCSTSRFSWLSALRKARSPSFRKTSPCPDHTQLLQRERRWFPPSTNIYQQTRNIGSTCGPSRSHHPRYQRPRAGLQARHPWIPAVLPRKPRERLPRRREDQEGILRRNRTATQRRVRNPETHIFE